MMRLILGGPGAGKTTRLLDIMEEELARGTPPDRIAFVSFTRKAVNEAATRAMEKFKVAREDLPYFRTLHSLAYRFLGLNRQEILGKRHLSEIGDMLGLKVTGGIIPDELGENMTLGDRMLFMEGFARSVCKSREEIWQDKGENITWWQFKQFIDTYDHYKKDLSLIDFTDMLYKYIEECNPAPVEVAIIDEAQDLNPIQWKVVFHAFKNVPRIYIAGDDDQAIYRWSGADIDQFLSLPITDKEVLPVSWRLPRSIFKMATNLANQLSKRYAKDWKPFDKEGEIHYYSDIQHVDLTEGRWLILARNTHFLRRFKHLAEAQGTTYSSRQGNSVDKNDATAIMAYENLRRGHPVPGSDICLMLDKMNQNFIHVKKDQEYLMGDLGLSDRGKWHELDQAGEPIFPGIAMTRVEYYLSVLRRGGKLLAPPKIHIDTIHSSKGGEEDNVLLFPDMTRRTYDGFCSNPDDEARVFYVGMTRTKQALHIVFPQTSRFFPL